MSESLARVEFHVGDGCPSPWQSVTAREQLASALRTTVAHFPRVVARIDVQLVGDDAMAAAHQQFSQLGDTTDVLSFPAHNQTDPNADVEVDLIVCVDVAAREAAARAHSIDHEILLYAVHGTLHACGFRDDSDVCAQEIHREEDRILCASGIGCVYSVAVRTDLISAAVPTAFVSAAVPTALKDPQA